MQNLVNKIATIKGTEFASFEYVNKQGVVSTYNVLMGAIYGNAVEKNIESLSNAHFSNELEETARIKLLTALVNNQDKKTASNQSKSHENTYVILGKGFRVHKEKKVLSLLAYVMGKTQTEEQKRQTRENEASGLFEVKKVSKPRALTIAQNKVKKALKLKATNMVSFNFTEETLLGGKVDKETFIF